jgi:capsular polysaccharide biosynthesis protein
MNRPLKEPGKRMDESYRGRWGGARLQYLRLLGGSRKRALLRDYHDRCKDPDFSAPYVFLALHYQPEQTTSPTGGVFVDQQIAVDMLARLAPPGWRVYVKEHPFQFFPTSIGERSRQVDFYDDLLSYPNVTLVPWSVSPFDLIDGARAVATVTGTTGIEAVMRGKPVLVFGHAWYAGCEGAFYTPDSATCREVLARIADGYTVDRRRVRLFLRAVQDSCFRADMDFGVTIDPPISHEQNVARLAAGIRRVYERGRTRVTPVHHEDVVGDPQLAPEA